MKSLFLIFLMVVSASAQQQLMLNPSLTVAATPPDVTGELALYYLDGNVNDSSGNGYNATTTGSPTYGLSENNSTANGAIVLNGSSQYFATPIAPITQLTGNFSISFWAYSSNNAAGGYAYCSAVSGGSRFYLAIPDASSPTSVKLGLSSWNPVETGILTTNTWHYWVVVLNGTTGYLYEDGVLKDSQSNITISIPGAVINVGYQTAGSESYFSGLIDDFRIYPFALTGTQISALYTRGAKQ